LTAAGATVREGRAPDLAKWWESFSCCRYHLGRTAQSRFTALFEAMVVDWLKMASFAAVARQCRLSWDQVSGTQERAVRRGRSRRAVAAARRNRGAWLIRGSPRNYETPRGGSRLNCQPDCQPFLPE